MGPACWQHAEVSSPFTGLAATARNDVAPASHISAATAAGMEKKKYLETRLDMMRERHAVEIHIMNLKEQLLRKKLVKEEFKITSVSMP